MEARTATERTPLWRDVRVLRVAFQVAVLAAVGASIAYLYDNLQANQRRLGISSSFDFLDQPAGFRIAYSDFLPGEPIRNALYTGMKNTIIVALVGIVLTLVLGTLVGIARLSGNWIVRKTAGTYVEFVRNLPPLLVILLVNTAALANLPPIQEPTKLGLPGLGEVLLLSNRESAVVSVRDDGAAGAYTIALLAALAGAIAVRWFLQRREDRVGQPQHGFLWAVTLFGVVAIGGYFALAAPVVWSHPEVVGRSIQGGLTMGLPFFSVLVGLVVYTSTHVAEIVRGSILAVPRGQSEAANAIGLSSGHRLRFVVLPQAFRVAVPPIINQFLNLTKNTSLGVAVAYTETMYVGRTVIGNGQPAIQVFLVAMAFYLVVSLIISLFSNVVNRRLQLVER